MNSVEKFVNETEKKLESGEITRNEANTRLRWALEETRKSKKMEKPEKKELAHRIIKIILEVLLQIITMGLPALINGGKTIFKHK